MICSSNELYLIQVDSVINECELIIKHPTRTMKSSTLARFESVLQKGRCDDFYKECINAGEINLTIMPISGPIKSHILEEAMEKRVTRKAAKKLYSRDRLVKNQIGEQLKTERAQDRKSLLKLAYILTTQIEFELKEKLMK